MDDPDITNSIGVAVEQTDTMTSLSPSKRTIALGVVNTSGMKSSSSNRKRRWDQPPDESGEMPCVKKVHLNEPVESPESALERLTDESIDSPNKFNMLNSNELDTVTSNSDQVMSDGNDMSIDVLPEEVCDRLGGFPEVSDVTTSSEHNECKSTVVGGSAVECSGSVSNEKVNNISSDLRLGVLEVDEETDTPSNPVNENPVVSGKEQQRKTSTVISHQSDELRRIMFSYNEGTSESDSNDSNGVSLKADSPDNKTEKAILENSEDISKLESSKENSKPNINPFSETSISINDKMLLSDEKENCLSDENLNKGSEKADSKSYNDIDSIEMADSSINKKTESQINIPNKNEMLLNTSEVNCVQVPEQLFTDTDKTTTDTDSISSGKSELKLISDSENDKCNEKLECDSSSTTSKIDDKIQSEGDSMRLLKENVIENTNEAEISNTPDIIVPDDSGPCKVVYTSESVSKNENSSDLISSKEVVSGINEIKTPEVESEILMLMETSDICKVKESVSDTTSLTADITLSHEREELPEEGFKEDSYKTEQLPNVTTIKENSIDVNAISLDDENSNNLKSDVEEQSLDKVTCDFNSENSLKTVDSNCEAFLDASPKSNLDNCSETTKACISLGETPISDQTAISNTDKSELVTTINESFAPEMEANVECIKNEPEISIKKIDKIPTELSSDDIDPDVMNVIFGSAADSSRGVGSLKDEISSIEPSTPDSDSNTSKNTMLLDTHINQIEKETASEDLPESVVDSTKESITNCEIEISKTSVNEDPRMVLEVSESAQENEFMEDNPSEVEEKTVTDLEAPPSQNVDPTQCEVNEEGMPMEEEELIDKPIVTPQAIDVNEKQEAEHGALEENKVFSNEIEMLDDESSLAISESKDDVTEPDEAYEKSEEMPTVLFRESAEEGKDEKVQTLITPVSKENCTPEESNIEDVDLSKVESSGPEVRTRTESALVEEIEIVKEKTELTTSTKVEGINVEIEEKTGPIITKEVGAKSVPTNVEESENVIEENTEPTAIEETEIVIEENIEPNKVEEIEIVDSFAVSQDDKEDSVKSPSITNESIVNNSDDSKEITEEIETFDVVEEVVTCENSGSEQAVEPEIEEVINDDENAQFASEETQESVESSDDLVAVMDNDTSDAKVSDSENQNVVISTGILINADENLSTEAIEEKEDTVESTARSRECPPVEIVCETSTVNSITKMSIEDEEMEIDEVPGTETSIVNKVKNVIPLLKPVSSPSVRNKEPKIFEKENVKDEPLHKAESIIPSSQPITIKIYKDNLSIKTDDLDSPKKHKSPKLSSEPLHSKVLENVSSLSPQNKQFEYTLKIAKDVNTNIPKAIMSPKSNMSPSWKLESGPNSPHSPGESGIGSLKLKLSKPSPSGLPNDLCSSLAQSNKHAEVSNRLGISEEKKEESKTTLPKPPLEMGSALKMMMEVDKMESSRSEGTSILEQALCGSVSDTPVIVRKRGRPRLDNDINHSPKPNPSGEGEEAADSGALDTSGEDQGSSRQVRSCRARTQPIVTKTRKPRGGGATSRGGGRGGARGVARPIASAEEAEKIQEKLSEKEKAELAKIEARKEKMRLDRIAKNEAKKAKKLAKKLKDEERRKRIAAEKAEKAAAAAPQVFEEETRMSASESRGHTPAPSSRLMHTSEGMEESQYSIGGTPVATPKTGNHKGRMEIPIDPESDEVRVDQLAEYQWQGSELCMIQEQVSLYLGVKSFKRKYPDLKRRIVEAEERAFLEDSGLVSKHMCDLGLTAVSSAEILDIMYQDFPDKYEAFRQHVRDKQAREMSFKQKALASQTQTAKAKGELRELALEAAAMWNSNLNRERREERRCALDLQTFTVHYPKHERERMSKSPLRPGLYPVSVIPGQFSDYYKTYTPTELMYFPLNTVMYGPLKPNERRDGSDSSSSSSDDTSGTSDSENDSDDEERVSKECKICNGEKRSTSDTHPEILLQCSQCKGLCHPTCQEITPEMLPHIKKYSWHCSNCKKCVQCKDTSKEEKMLFCDLCDRGYHISCVGLRKSPEGRWHCSVCSFCTLCGSKDPGGAEWFYEYKKTDKGVRLYQRTLCVPCSKNALM